MSLQVWLPLNGNLNNKGLSDVTITNNGATAENSGKIGQCYTFNGSNNYMQINNLSLNGKAPVSISIWYKYSSIEGYKSVFELGNNDLNGLCIRGQYLEYGDGAQNYYILINSLPNITGVWNHIAVTYDGIYIKIYLNGSLIHTANGPANGIGTNSVCYIGKFWAGYLNGTVNDFRIYDHCLSASEVKEISKGLVLHYPFNDPYEIRKENHQLINNGNFANNVDGWNWSGMKAGYVIANNTLSYTGTNYYSYFIKYLYNFDANHIYFFKCQYMHNYTTDIRWEGKHENGNGIYTKDMPASNSFVNFYHRFTALSTNPGTMLQVYGTSQTDSASISFKNCMLFDLTKMYGSGCEPDEETCKKIFTADYYSYIAATYNVNNTITDCSGYGYNGTMDTNLSISAASPRYNLSTYFNGIDNCIVVPYNSVCPTNIYTMNVWFYKEHLGHKTYETLFGGPNGFEIDSRCGDSANLVLYREGGYSICQMDFNRWNMVTFVHDAATEYYYVNGELKASREVKAMPVGEYYIGAWAAKTQQNYEGKMSDFRIYATALSANDIQELYNTSAKINKNGTLMCYEIKED